MIRLQEDGVNGSDSYGQCIDCKAIAQVDEQSRCERCRMLAEAYEIIDTFAVHHAQRQQACPFCFAQMRVIPHGLVVQHQRECVVTAAEIWLAVYEKERIV